MKPAQRWPLHPAPKEGEALFSWLRRVATCYRMEVSDLLEHDLGHGQVDDLDIAPPMSLLNILSQRSGIGLDRLCCMSIAGWTPWLLDSLDDTIPFCLETYVFQLSVLLPKRNRKPRSATSWRAWLPMRPLHRACPRCIRDSTDNPLLLMWQLPLLLSCPTHGCWLETYLVVTAEFIVWDDFSCEPRQASASITAMDRRTWQALTAGYVELPCRRVHAGLWLRLLRTLLDELSTPISQCGPCRRSICYVWKRCGYPPRAGQSLWRPYEILDTAVQLQTLEAAACAIELIESGELNPRGEQAPLFLPEPQTGFTNGLPAYELKKEPVSHWREAMKMLDKAIAEAQHDPEAARALFRVVSLGQRNPVLLERLRATFAEAEIPLEFLSDCDSE